MDSRKKVVCKNCGWEGYEERFDIHGSVKDCDGNIEREWTHKKALCPKCGERISGGDNVDLGRKLTCKKCGWEGYEAQLFPGEAGDYMSGKEEHSWESCPACGEAVIRNNVLAEEE